ncbi:MAG: hypothetical protein GX638_09860, partial [Crenarchaeota archaeon]|nr:hypothetical protein [Thermoproteota archaeon]
MKKNLFLKKSLFVLLYIFSFLLSGFSQILVNENYKSLSENQKQEKRDSIINNSDYILYGAFAGELVIFTDENKKDIYRITRIYVRDVIRGPQELKNTHIYSISKV